MDIADSLWAESIGVFEDEGKIDVTDQLPFQRLGIYGVGLLGGSLGLALKEVSPYLEIVGIGRSEERLQAAKDLGAIDTLACDPSSIGPPLDLLVLCTPVRLVPKILQATLSSLSPNAIVTDVGSTKRILVHQCETIAEGHCCFVGSHPMAGSHKTGVEAARKDLFRHKICIVTETDRTDALALQKIVHLWKSVGMRIVQMSPDHHDRLTAHSSHLPHLIASTLCQVAQSQGAEIESVLGDGFRDTTRIAQGDPAMWVDICLENRDAILDSIDSFRSVLDQLSSHIEQADEESLRKFLTQAQIWKKQRRPS